MATASLMTLSCDYYCINSATARRHHIYKDIWMAEELMCLKELGNVHDLHAVATLCGSYMIGHVSLTISTPYSVPYY